VPDTGDFRSGGFSNFGMHNLSGTPSYVGGSNPANYGDYAITVTSIGYKAASDGTNIGINIGTSPPAAPTSLTAKVN
jgi:hypothetical protein